MDVRSLFVPRPGKKFIICDLAQIEPRVMAWLVDDDKLLDLVKSGKDIYTAHALATMGAKVVTKELRQLAKIRVLGLGYGCGAARFRDLAGSWGCHMELDQARAVVQNYRNSNAKIYKLHMFKT